MADRRYKGYRIYAYIALARLFAELDLDLEQRDLLDRARERLAATGGGVSKEEILRAIRSNSHMTDKVLEFLGSEGLVTVRRGDHGYRIQITEGGVAHLQAYRRFYREIYARELAEHYRYVGAPSWIGGGP